MTMYKPIILKIIPKVGYPIEGARVQYEAPQIDGFLAIESQEIKNTTTYIAIDNIASFSVLNEEACNITAYFPEPTIKVRER